MAFGNLWHPSHGRVWPVLTRLVGKGAGIHLLCCGGTSKDRISRGQGAPREADRYCQPFCLLLSGWLKVRTDLCGGPWPWVTEGTLGGRVCICVCVNPSLFRAMQKPSRGSKNGETLPLKNQLGPSQLKSCSF